MSSHWKLNLKVNNQQFPMPDTEKLKDKVAIVTGAAQGLGKEIAIEFARQGAHIVLIDINQKEAQRVENLLHKKIFMLI